MIYIVYFLTLFLILPTKLMGMYTTFSKPTYWQEKPRFDRMNMTSYELTYFHSWASQSFNKDGQKVPLLAFANAEPLLPSFLEPFSKCTLPTNNKKETPIGYALFDGKYSMDVITNEIIQNFRKHFFVQINIPITHEHLKDISITPTDACGNRLFSNKVNSYIEKLRTKLFEDNSRETQSRSFIGPSFLLFGLTKSFTHFNHLDLLDLEFKTGLVIPVIKLSETEPLSIFPHNNLDVFGIPFQFKLLLGVYNWLNFGVSSAVVLHIPKDDVFPINESPYPNNLIIPTTQMAKMSAYPFITFTTYVEGEYFLPHWIWYIGFNFVKQYKTVWDINAGTTKENQIANSFPSQRAWQQGAITLTSEIDFASDEKQMMPRFRISYIKRIFGKGCFASSVIAGHLGFEILYDF